MKHIHLCTLLALTFYSAQTTAAEATAENTGNPAISVIGNFTGERIRGDGGVSSSSFLPLSETEIIFGANIDPHSRLDVTVTAADGGMAVEEGYITSKLPYGINAKKKSKLAAERTWKLCNSCKSEIGRAHV